MNVVGDGIKGLTEVRVDDISSSTLVRWFSNSVVEGHQTNQAQFARGEAMFAVINHICLSCLDITSRRICSLILLISLSP